MKIKATLWIDDPQTDELTDVVKKDLEVWIRNDAFADAGVVIKQIQIEETEFED